MTTRSASHSCDTMMRCCGWSIFGKRCIVLVSIDNVIVLHFLIHYWVIHQWTIPFSAHNHRFFLKISLDETTHFKSKNILKYFGVLWCTLVHFAVLWCTLVYFNMIWTSRVLWCTSIWFGPLVYFAVLFDLKYAISSVDHDSVIDLTSFAFI